jgi:3',5'-cyclic AMP phosphodiesterase CpdA
MLQISDPHLSATRSWFVPNFDLVAALAPAYDLVVGTGDIGLDDPDDAGDQAFARTRFAALGAPWRVIPGNHDVGDTEPDPWMGQPVTDERRHRWVERWGADWWVEEADAWVVIGLDSLLFASDLPAEAEQWAWLEGVAGGAGDRPVMVILHKPPWLWERDERDVTQSAVTPEGRRRLRDALGDARVRVFASGHVHQFRTWAVDGVVSVWAPSTAFVSHPAEASVYGAGKVVGAVAYTFRGRSIAWELVRPAGMVDHDIWAIADGAETLRFAAVHPLAGGSNGRGGADRAAQ